MEAVSEQNDEDRRIKAGTLQEEMPAGEPVPEFEATDREIESGLQSQERMHPEEPEPEGLPEEYADDPLAEFIEMDGDEPMLRTVVNGQQQLVPLEKARANLQKSMAADARLQEAAETRRALEERERQLEERERQLAASAQNSAPPPDKGAELSNEQLREQARDLVGELFTGTQEEAAEKLAKLIAARSAPATSFDPQKLAQQAAAAAREQLSAEARQKDVEKGFKKFKADYPEIANDEVLFQLADGMSTKIAQENPEWMPSQVMHEAGKRTRDWVKAQRGESPEAETSEQPPAQNERRERKRTLRRVPRQRQGLQPREDEAVEPEPADLIAEIRKARGLPD
jgi:hypothetical protein